MPREFFLSLTPFPASPLPNQSTVNTDNEDMDSDPIELTMLETSCPIPVVPRSLQRLNPEFQKPGHDMWSSLSHSKDDQVSHPSTPTPSGELYT